ncbi:hypothetical protein PsorP6_016205 [Peronosclerospora sorghi]|uniref:Uncharacterized protein n=1 Tax=Peronosclerospora sorghi TaxID=230839 RepID=A0ACC0VK32_9STRA|nr:hypothetical protein PsorP6_016205 [Peronosclerospora sorghi]
MAAPAPTLPALLKALRQPSSSTAVSSEIEQAVDLLIATSSLSDAQILFRGLKQNQPWTRWYEKLQQAAAICTEPSSKAEYLGFVLLEESVRTIQECTVGQALLEIFHANHNVLPGYVSALTARDGPVFHNNVTSEQVLKTLEMISPIFQSVLMDTNSVTAKHRVAVLDATSRMVWNFYGHEDDKYLCVWTSSIHMLVQALELIPHGQLTQPTYVVHVKLVIDLLSTHRVQRNEHVALAKRTALIVLESIQLFILKNEGVVTLLQSLELLATAVPEAFWCSIFLTSAASFLVAKCHTPFEQQWMLQILEHALEFGRKGGAGRRCVYVEILLLPLSSLLAVHGTAVSRLLRLVMTIKSTSQYVAAEELKRMAYLTETANHARLAMQMIQREETCQQWLSCLFLPQRAAPSKVTDAWVATIVVALLSDERSALCGRAAACLERQTTNYPRYWGAETTKALVASVVFLVSQPPSGNVSVRSVGTWMTSCLYSLAALATTTTDTMRLVLRLIDRMNGTTRTRPIALKLIYEVWQNESRVFPRLETMLLESTSGDEELERHVVKMSLIKSLCEKDPELGVQFIASIQAFLEDALTSVVAMALDAITALCRGDCLDFYVAFKIIAQKLRKKTIVCAGKALFQERLCCFYALGGADYAAHKSHASKLSNQTWKFTESHAASVRRAAYKALSSLPLDMIGLSMPVSETTRQECDEEVEEIDEQLDVLMERLQNESDVNVRLEIEGLVAKVIAHESAKLSAGVGRGQRMVSTASGGQLQQQVPVPLRTCVSATATKELKTLLPSRSEVETLISSSPCSSSSSALLLVYRPKTLIDTKSVTRKDKLVRLATQNVGELVASGTHLLESLEVPWASVDDDEHPYHVFVRIQVLMEGWKGFMATYLSSVDKLAELKTPVGVDDANVAFRVFSENVATFLDLLLNTTANNVGGAVAAGALAGRLCESRHWHSSHLRVQYEDTVKELSRRLALSMTQARVFSADKRDPRVESIGAVIALQLSFGQRKVDTSEKCRDFCLVLEKIKGMFMEMDHDESDKLLRSCALLGLSHVATVFSSGHELESFETAQWRCKRIQPIAKRILDTFVHMTQPNQSKTSFICQGDTIFPLQESTGATPCNDAIVFDFKPSSSQDGTLLRWASSIGLARLSSSFSGIKRVDWLLNVQRLLTAIWKEKELETIVAVALGPVLMQCVRLNVAPSSCLEQFVTTCNHRAAASGATSVDSGFVMMAATNVLCRLDSFGGFQKIIKEQTELAMQFLEKRVEKRLLDESGSDQRVNALLLYSMANFFHCTFGIAESCVVATANVDDQVELTLGRETIITLVKLLRQAARYSGIAKAMLGAIARKADGFYVSHKKQSFDAELRSLPSNSLLMKLLNWLRQVHPGSKPLEPRTAISVLHCLSSTGDVLPLMDYATLTRRVMLRFCSVDVSVACVRFSATQGSCDDFLVRELFDVEWFGNVDGALQTEMMTWLSVAATRLQTDVLDSLLVKIFYFLKDIWRRDTSSTCSSILFDAWSAMLRELLHPTPPRRIPASSSTVVNTFILEKVLMELPFDVHASSFVEQFALRVLSSVDYGEHNLVETVLTRDVVHASLWSWWRSGIFLVELANLDVLTITKRESLQIFQWLLRHDFHEWMDDKLVDMYLEPLLTRIGALLAQHTRPVEYASSLLDLIDAFSGSMSSSSTSCHDFIQKDARKRRALFNVMASILSWNAMMSFETHLVHLSRSEVDNMGINAMDLLPFGLVACGRGTKIVWTLGERLWLLLKELVRRKEDESVVEYTFALQWCSRQIYLTIENGHPLSSMSTEIRAYWSNQWADWSRLP